jgi:hypothetical protein
MTSRGVARAGFLALVAAGVFSMAGAQGSGNNNGSTGSPFLGIGVGARAMAMGGAYTGLAEGPQALFWNPAGISTTDQISLTFEYTRWVAEMSLNSVGAVIPLTDQFKLGLSVISFSSGDIEITTIEQPKGTGQSYDVTDLALGGTLGWLVTQDISVGATLKYIRNDLYTLSATGIAFDFGAQFFTRFHSLVVALVVANLGATRQYRGDALDFQYPPPYPGAEPIPASYNNVPFSLPLTYRAGLLVEVFEMLDAKNPDQKIYVAGDLVQPTEGPEKFHVGGEYSFKDMLFVRTGYIFNADELGFNAGAGVRLALEDVQFDVAYAFSDLKRFSAVHRIGVGVALR